MKLKPIKNSHVTGLGYDKATKELTVRFEGGATYEYAGVTPGQFSRILKAKSVGHMVFVAVEGKKFERVDK